MYIGAISMRYARALLMFANDADVAAKVYQEALTLRKSFREVPELRSAMEKPVMTKENKLLLLKQAAGGEITEQMQKFFSLVLQEKREKYLEIMQGVDPAELSLVSGIIDEVVYCECEMERLRALPFLAVHPKDPNRQKQTAAARLYKQMQTSYSNNIRILLNVLRKVESSAADDLLSKLRSYS